ncbi:hypothetical protein PGT21_001503 [Puccinia graminis f. sp. tritici]|uniref:Uncharacterized protein n=1 Tax=Puccinia graminis f. sp. tritici TaxID=56615 RepID=A0A5B0P7J5_PUCGR|nr:hypothetical protein PGT21_001503 [Puccinia graminis f. sp. tritici]
MTEGLPETTHWIDSGCTQLAINNLTVSLDDVKHTIQQTFQSIGQLLSLLTQGVKLPVFDRVAYEDQPHMVDVGFNYLVASAKYHDQYSGRYLLESWMAAGDPWGFSKYGETWDRSTVQKWLDMANELTKALYFCVHCGCGQPARGTEEMTVKIVNTPEAMRNVFWRNAFASLFGFHPAYSNLLDQLDHIQHLLTHLWVDTSLGLFTTAHQTSVLHRTFLKHNVAPLGVNPWRHLCVAVCDQWLKEHPRIGLVDDDDEEDEDGSNHGPENARLGTPIASPVFTPPKTTQLPANDTTIAFRPRLTYCLPINETCESPRFSGLILHNPRRLRGLFPSSFFFVQFVFGPNTDDFILSTSDRLQINETYRLPINKTCESPRLSQAARVVQFLINETCTNCKQFIQNPIYNVRFEHSFYCSDQYGRSLRGRR